MTHSGHDMLDFETRKIMSAAPAVSVTADRIAAADAKPLSPLAQSLAAHRLVPAWSPIVLAGFVRLIEFALTALVGFAIYVGYVVPHNGFEWSYVAVIFGI